MTQILLKYEQVCEQLNIEQQKNQALELEILKLKGNYLKPETSKTTTRKRMKLTLPPINDFHDISSMAVSEQDSVSEISSLAPTF